MTGTDPDPRDGRRRRAAGQLGLAPDAGPAEVRAAFLRLLERAGFAPPARDRRAWRLLSEAAGPAEPDPDALLEEEQRLRAEVEDFAGRFWSLAPGERRRQWAELLARCAGAPGARARLQQLEIGLSARPGEAGAGGPLVGELAAAVQDLFVLRPADRAAARQALCRRARENPGDWEAAARGLREQHPDLAALQPGLVTDLERWQERQQHLATMRQRLKNPPKAPAPKPAARPAGKGSFRWVWIVALLALGGLRAVMSSSSDHGTPTTPALRPPAGPQKDAGRPDDVLPPELRDKLFKPGGADDQDPKKVREEIERQKRDLGVEEHRGEDRPPAPGRAVPSAKTSP